MTGTVGDVWTKVTEWLLARDRSGWPARQVSDHVRLCEMWSEVSLRYGDESPPACGALLALVREAWGYDDGETRPEVEVEWCSHDVARVVIWVLGCRHEFDGGTLARALAAALMVAPTQKGGES